MYSTTPKFVQLYNCTILYWQELSMKYSSHIGAVVVENVRIYQDLRYIFVISMYLQHKILESLRRRAKLIDASTAAY